MHTKEWVTVQECIGAPGFPNTAPSVRKRLDELSKNHSSLRRKRAGTKATEYHVSLLPDYLQNYFGNQVTELCKPEVSDTINPSYNNELHALWDMIFKLLSLEEKQCAIDIFKRGGLNALLPEVMGLSQTPDVQSKEILHERGCLPEGSPTASVETASHGTKKAG